MEDPKGLNGHTRWPFKGVPCVRLSNLRNVHFVLFNLEKTDVPSQSICCTSLKFVPVTILRA